MIKLAEAQQLVGHDVLARRPGTRGWHLGRLIALRELGGDYAAEVRLSGDSHSFLTDLDVVGRRSRGEERVFTNLSRAG